MCQKENSALSENILRRKQRQTCIRSRYPGTLRFLRRAATRPLFSED